MPTTTATENVYTVCVDGCEIGEYRNILRAAAKANAIRSIDPRDAIITILVTRTDA